MRRFPWCCSRCWLICSAKQCCGELKSRSRESNRTMSTATASVQPVAIKTRTARDKVRLIGNNFLTVICIVLSFLTLIPLFSIVYLVVQKGLPLLRPSVFMELPPAPGVEGGGFGNAIQGTLLMVLLALAIA